MKQEATCWAGVGRASCPPSSHPPHPRLPLLTPAPPGPVIYHMADGRAVFPTQPRSRCLPRYNLYKRQIESAAVSLAAAAAAAEPLGMTVIINTLVQTLIKTATNCRGSGPVGGGGCQQCDRTAFLVNDITCLRGGRRGEGGIAVSRRKLNRRVLMFFHRCHGQFISEKKKILLSALIVGAQ